MHGCRTRYRHRRDDEGQFIPPRIPLLPTTPATYEWCTVRAGLKFAIPPIPFLITCTTSPDRCTLPPAAFPPFPSPTLSAGAPTRRFDPTLTSPSPAAAAAGLLSAARTPAPPALPTPSPPMPVLSPGHPSPPPPLPWLPLLPARSSNRASFTASGRCWLSFRTLNLPVVPASSTIAAAGANAVGPAAADPAATTAAVVGSWLPQPLRARERDSAGAIFFRTRRTVPCDPRPSSRTKLYLCSLE